MFGLLLRWFGTAVAVGVAAHVVAGLHVEGGFAGLLSTALVLGLVNALVRPILQWLSCGLIVITFGLFILVINALMLLLAAAIAQALGIGLMVHGFGAALLGALVISLVSFLLSFLVDYR